MTGYSGNYNGSEYKSLYPNLYRVTYDAFIGGRPFNVDKVIAASDAQHARSRVTGDVRGTVDVEHVATLEAKP